MGYTASFKSLAGKTCTIDIDGGGTAVTAASNPFKWEENDSDDLLDVIRHRSGYINLVESSFGALDALHPQHSTDLSVVMSYDGKVVFKGFIQAQDFDSPYAPGPNVISLPVVSPLGVMCERHLATRAFSSDYDGVKEISTSGSDLQNYLNSSGTWATATSSDYGRFIAITPGKKYIVVSGAAGRAAVVKSSSNIGGSAPDYCSGFTKQELSASGTFNFENAYTFTAPSNAAYLYIAMMIGGTACLTSIIEQPADVSASGVETIGSVMKEICTALGIEYVIIPKALLTNSVNPMHVFVSKRVLCPYNDEYNFGTNDLFNPITYSEFVEGVCNLYGLIAHDSVDADGKAVLVFSKFGYSGAWLKMAVNTLNDTSVTGTESSQPSETLFNNYSMANGKGTVSHVRPIGKLEIDHGDIEDSVDMDLTLATLGSAPTGREGSLYNIGKVIYFIPLSVANGGQFVSVYLNANDTAYYSDYSTTTGNETRTAGDGGKEVVDVMYRGATNPPSYTPLFEYIFTSWPRSIFGVVMRTLNHSFAYRIQIESGGKYVAGAVSHSWGNTPTFLQFNQDENGDYLITDIPKTEYPVIVRIYPDMFSSQSLTIFGDPITNLSLDVDANPLNKYLVNLDSSRRIINQSGEYETASINCIFHDHINNFGRIIGGSLAEVNDYAYMFVSKTLLKVTVKRTSTAALDLSRAYLQNVTLQTGGASGWRVIAVGFNPWDDEYEFTLIKA